MVLTLEDLIPCLAEQTLQTSLQMAVAEELIILKVNLEVVVAELAIIMDKQVQELQIKVLTEEDVLNLMVTVEAAEALAKTELQETLTLVETVVMVYPLQSQAHHKQEQEEELEDHIEQTQEV